MASGPLPRAVSSGVWHHTVALVLEIASPDDDSWNKFDFFAPPRSDWRTAPASGSSAELGPAELDQRLDWPALEP